MAKIKQNDKKILMTLSNGGMKIIDSERGLDQAAFKAAVLVLCKEKSALIQIG